MRHDSDNKPIDHGPNAPPPPVADDVVPTVAEDAVAIVGVAVGVGVGVGAPPEALYV